MIFLQIQDAWGSSVNDERDEDEFIPYLRDLVETLPMPGDDSGDDGEPSEASG